MMNRSLSCLPRALTLLGGCAIAACSDDASRTALREGPPPAEPEHERPQPVSEHSAISVGASVREPARYDEESAPVEQLPDLYDPATIPEIALTFDAAAMAVLTSTNEADKKTWVHARLDVGGVTFADVGVRRKGSSTYRVLPEKASLKIKINKWVKGQKLHGLEELTLNNMVSDPTFLHERLAFYTFGAMGLPAPRANTAHVTINGEDYGIFVNIETPDENFVARAFGGKARTLYEVKSGGSAWLPGLERYFEIDIGIPGAPAGTRPDLDPLLASVANAKDETLLADLASRLHTTQWLRHCAAEAVTGHYDGYAFGTYGFAHNYYVAGDLDGRFSMMTWSTDLTFADRGATLVDAANPIGNTIFTRCKNSAACWDAYKAQVASVLGVYESLDLLSVAKKWHDQIDPLVRSDPKKIRTIPYYEKETAHLYDWIAKRPAVVRTQLGL